MRLYSWDVHKKGPLYTYWNQVYPHVQFAIRGTVGRWKSLFLRHLPGSLPCSKHQICLTVGKFWVWGQYVSKYKWNPKNPWWQNQYTNTSYFVGIQHWDSFIPPNFRYVDDKKIEDICWVFLSKKAAYCWDPNASIVIDTAVDFRHPKFPPTQNPLGGLYQLLFSWWTYIKKTCYIHTNDLAIVQPSDLRHWSNIGSKDLMLAAMPVESDGFKK